MLPFAISFNIFLNVSTFLYVQANSKEIGEEILFPSFFRKMLMSAFLLRFKANYLAKCVATPIFLFQRSTFSAWCKFGAKSSVFGRHLP